MFTASEERKKEKKVNNNRPRKKKKKKRRGERTALPQPRFLDSGPVSHIRPGLSLFCDGGVLKPRSFLSGVLPISLLKPVGYTMRVSEQRKRTELELSGVELHLCEFFLRQSLFDILTVHCPPPFLCASEKEAESVLYYGHIIASLEMEIGAVVFWENSFSF